MGMFDEEMAEGMRATQLLVLRHGIPYAEARRMVLEESRNRKPIIRFQGGVWVLWDHQFPGARALIQSASLASLIGIVRLNPQLFKRA